MCVIQLTCTFLCSQRVFPTAFTPPTLTHTRVCDVTLCGVEFALWDIYIVYTTVLHDIFYSIG